MLGEVQQEFRCRIRKPSGTDNPGDPERPSGSDNSGDQKPGKSFPDIALRQF